MKSHLKTHQQLYDRTVEYLLSLDNPDLRITPWGDYKGLKCVARLFLPEEETFCPKVFATPFGIFPGFFQAYSEKTQRLLFALQQVNDNPTNWHIPERNQGVYFGLNRCGRSDLICIAASFALCHNPILELNTKCFVFNPRLQD